MDILYMLMRLCIMNELYIICVLDAIHFSKLVIFKPIVTLNSLLSHFAGGGTQASVV